MSDASSRRHVRGWGALSLAVGAVLVSTAAQSPADPDAGSFAAPEPTALVTVDGCSAAGGLCSAPRRTVELRGGRVLTGEAVTLGDQVSGPVELALRTPGVLADVTVTDQRGRRVAGVPSIDGTRWTSAAPLTAGARYAARLVVERAGAQGRDRHVARLDLRTVAAPAGERLTVTFGPDDGGTYGVGQPVTAELSHPVPADESQARRVVERALLVRTEPHVEGAWYWVDSDTLHYRPRGYWPARTTVRVRSALDGARVIGGLYGGRSRPVTFTTGARIEAVTDVSALTTTVFRDGEPLRTFPVTTGKAGYRTRGGTKVVLGKEPLVRMRGDSIGIARGNSDYFDLKVRWATRVTWSGEYLHAAPWSLDAQGSENVSHGCTGMSTEDAAWLFSTVREGDLVRVVNGYGELMTPFDNGFGDWNLSWPEWRRGSAFASGTAAPRSGSAGAALRPTL
ncbi:Ig-like domain-containing protein [Streptomyces sp. NBC_00233]|uniref:L,D-transpeptidase n=1 Tax=Streptomyces sp. NBC_00233 TaxID=2975686 RepID=UPI00224D836B|nr:Ig-like domain-containing protein [Streptomyces sp. NBC_00233]MCX5230970.1 Ig-like domain-containing protein [Streptomyces sp. NBC_00233]